MSFGLSALFVKTPFVSAAVIWFVFIGVHSRLSRSLLTSAATVCFRRARQLPRVLSAENFDFGQPRRVGFGVLPEGFQAERAIEVDHEAFVVDTRETAAALD